MGRPARFGIKASEGITVRLASGERHLLDVTKERLGAKDRSVMIRAALRYAAHLAQASPEHAKALRALLADD